MTSIDVVDARGAKSGSVDLPGDLFDAQVNIPLMHQVVLGQLAAARQGTHDTKTRGEVSGGGRKPYRQKGTGRARQGSTRAPQFTGGGTVHGPTPHGYAQRTPKKMKAAALRGALSDRARDGRIHVVDSFVDGDRPSTKAALSVLTKLTQRRRPLVVIGRDDELTRLSLRNVATVHVLYVDQLNTYDVLSSDDVVFTRGAYDSLVAERSTGTAPAAGVQDEQPASEVDSPAETPEVDGPASTQASAEPEPTATTLEADDVEAADAEASEIEADEVLSDEELEQQNDELRAVAEQASHDEEEQA